MQLTTTKEERLKELEAKKDPFNWDHISKNLTIVEDMFGDKFKGAYLGEIIELNPSGKIYTFWTSNQTKRDVERDTAFWERLERFADKKGFGITFVEESVYIFDTEFDPEEEIEDEEDEEDEGE